MSKIVNYILEECLGDMSKYEISKIVCTRETSISWYFKKDDEGRAKNANLCENTVMFNRQVNQKYYIPNGAIYIG